MEHALGARQPLDGLPAAATGSITTNSLPRFFPPLMAVTLPSCAGGAVKPSDLCNAGAARIRP